MGVTRLWCLPAHSFVSEYLRIVVVGAVIEDFLFLAGRKQHQVSRRCVSVGSCSNMWCRKGGCECDVFRGSGSLSINRQMHIHPKSRWVGEKLIGVGTLLFGRPRAVLLLVNKPAQNF